MNGIMNVRSAVHERILGLFAGNKITIPFPQRDVYIRERRELPEE